jgi:Domain of unknown function (DUF4190)
MANNYPPPSPYQPALQNSTTAIISLIAGIAGLTVFPVVGSIVAVILGHMAKGEIARSGGALGGGGAATAGLVLGYVGIGLSVLALCGFGLFFLCPILAVIFSSSSNNSWLPLLQFVA